MRALPTYRGRFGRPQAERLLWRAGFGPRPGEADKLAALGLHGAIRSLTRPRAERLTGPKPHDDNGNPLAPYDAWGHDQLWWLDRMVRTRRPLIERMTLVWHDWFATSNDGVDSQKLMLRQNTLFRTHALGSFRDLLVEVTRDPAMLLWLSGSDNSRYSPNENYGREVMELFTLGHGSGYTERDVREQARALTGFRNDWKDDVGPVNFRYDASYHDPGVKRIFGHSGRFTWRDSCRLCLEHPAHKTFFVRKLWSYFVPVAPPKATRHALERLYVRSGYQVRPLVEAILQHPLLYEGPRMVKSPVVYTAGLDVARRASRPAALLSAERRRVGRRPLARYGDLPGALADRLRGAQPVPPREEPARDRARPRKPADDGSGPARRSHPDRGYGWSFARVCR
jgi:hypothetical protein